MVPAPPAASAATVPQTTPAPSPVPAPSPEEMHHRRVTVDIESTKPSAVLERRVSITDGEGVLFFVPFESHSSIWEQSCVTPCQVDLDRFSTYRVAARNGIASSKPFTLPQESETMSLKIDAGDLTGHRIGRALSGGGLAAVIVGAALIAGQNLFTDETHARNAGFITGGAGLVLMAVGIPIFLMTQTNVTGPTGKIATLATRGLTF
jgi:hypothetical protein